MGGQKVRCVTATNRYTGYVLQGVQDIDTGVVYPFVGVDRASEVAAEVNEGREQIGVYGSLFEPGLYDIEAVA